MSESYPLLTVENVQYWYWERDPQMSGHDIAREVGCYFQKVYEFMKKHKIPIRNYSEAGKVHFQDPKKYHAYLKVRMRPEYLKKQSESHTKLWVNNPDLRQQRSTLLKGLYEKVLTEAQKVVLFVLKDKKEKFVRELVQQSSLGKDFFWRQMMTLRNRGLVSSVRKHDYLSNPKKKYSRYSITEKGFKVLNYNLVNDPFVFDDLVKKVKNRQLERPDLVESNKKYLGRNQKIILKILSSGKSYFAKDIYQLTDLKKIEKSLCMLYKRGFVDRKKEINANSKNRNKREYIYSLTESGSNLIMDMKN